MKTLKKIFKQEPVYIGFYDEADPYNELMGDFFQGWEGHPRPPEVHVLFAVKRSWSYEEDMYVLIEQDGKLFDIEGSHCSCYGFEGQWDPVETSLETIKMRIEQGRLGEGYVSDSFDKELKHFLGI